MKISKESICRILAGSLVALSTLQSGVYAAEAEAAILPAASVSDQRLGRQIHSTIVADPTLPYCAHVVNVEAENGVVTLKGRVHTRAERDNLRKKAATFVGEKNVITDIRVQPPIK